MSVYPVADFGCVTSAVVYGLDESIRRAKFPMAEQLFLSKKAQTGKE